MTTHAPSRWFARLGLAGRPGPAAQAAEWGTLTGRIVYDGKAPAPGAIKVDKDQEVCSKPTGRRIAGSRRRRRLEERGWSFCGPKTSTVAPDTRRSAKDDVVLDNKGCRFEPHVVVLRTTQTLVIKNSDPVGHNTKADAIKNAAFND